MDDKYGQNVYNKYNSGSGSNKNGSTQRTQVAGAYTGNGKGGYDVYTTYKNSKGEWGTGKEGYEYNGKRPGCETKERRDGWAFLHKP